MRSGAGVGDRAQDAIHRGVGAKQQNQSYHGHAWNEDREQSQSTAREALPATGFLPGVQHRNLRG